MSYWMPIEWVFNAIDRESNEIKYSFNQFVTVCARGVAKILDIFQFFSDKIFMLHC